MSPSARRDATLREITELIKEVNTDARNRQARISYSFIYPDHRGKTKKKKKNKRVRVGVWKRGSEGLAMERPCCEHSKCFPVALWPQLCQRERERESRENSYGFALALWVLT